MKFPKVLIALVAMAALSVCALAQSNVIENQTTYLYVDANSGSDLNPGTQALPFLTIGKAASQAKTNNVNGIGTKVFINPGVYRELLNIQPTYKQTAAPITFQATQTGTAVIAGSDILTGWSPSAANPSIYTHPWNYSFGFCPIPSGWPTGFAPVIQRTEMVYVNGQALTQVMDPSLIRSGTFYIDETANLISLWPSPTASMATAVVEAAVRPQTLNVSGRTNMVFRGLVFRHAASCLMQGGATVGSSTNILFDQVQANWNNWGGLAINSSNFVTVQNSVANYNGGTGFLGFRTRNALYQFDESDYNNWRGAMGAFYNWGMGGTKLFAMHGATVNQIHAYRNQAQGLWFDTDNRQITINNATLAENFAGNLQLEASEGPISLANSTLCSGGLGVNVINTASLTATGNTFYNNGGTAKWQGQFFLAGKPGGRVITDWETGQTYTLYTQNTTLSNNTFEDAGAGQFVFATYLSGTDWTQFTSTLASNNNYWFDPNTAKRFSIVNGKQVDLPGWQLNTAEDMASIWSSNSQTSNCAVPSTPYPDFSVNADNHTYTMVAGSGTIQLWVNSFSFGTVNLAVAGLPSGVTASFSTNTLISGNPVLTLAAASTAVNQTVPITIIVNRGSRVHTITVYVHVVPATTTTTL
ncbi:MAG TPA: right-handed parallel beta-helix repeat-containing protein [Acidisarcina sp.]|nr:right-handed parallel beta-helix repeat-containing protein [Acidisarcina sp.]